MRLYVGYGSDTDCDGTQDYIVLFWAADEDSAWEFVKARGGMTMEGVHKVAPADEALATGNLDGQHYRQAHSWLGREMADGIENPYGYCTTDTRWNPWVEDDTIGIPALDTRYEED